MADHVELRRGAYYDSVSLMQVSRTVAAAPGVEAAQVAMATELNLDVHRAAWASTCPTAAGPNDLVVAIRGDEAGIEAGQAALEAALADLRAALRQALGRLRRGAAAAHPRRRDPPLRTPTSRSSRCPASTPSPRRSTPSRRAVA